MTGLLEALAGEYAPTRRGRGPYWRPPAPSCTDLIIVSAYQWSRRYRGKTVTLDRNAAWLSAAASVPVGRGPVDQHGDAGEYEGRPGYYRVTVYPWTETETPHPLGAGVTPGRDVWVCGSRAGLLRELADAGRWPDDTVRETWTALESVRLSAWTAHIRDRRAAALDAGDDDAYDDLKISYSQAVALMIGRREPGHGRRFAGRIHRPDWGFAIQDQAAVTMWRAADWCARVAPAMPPVRVGNIDELELPAAALDTVTTVPRPGLLTPAIQIDPSGVRLGTWKIKDHG